MLTEWHRYREGQREIAGAGHWADVSFGVQAAKVLSKGKIDGFWANGMGAETAIREGVGKLWVDIRRGDELKKASITRSQR